MCLLNFLLESREHFPRVKPQTSQARTSLQPHNGDNYPVMVYATRLGMRKAVSVVIGYERADDLSVDGEKILAICVVTITVVGGNAILAEGLQCCEHMFRTPSLTGDGGAVLLLQPSQN